MKLCLYFNELNEPAGCSNPSPGQHLRGVKKHPIATSPTVQGNDRTQRRLPAFLVFAVLKLPDRSLLDLPFRFDPRVQLRSGLETIGQRLRGFQRAAGELFNTVTSEANFSRNHAATRFAFFPPFGVSLRSSSQPPRSASA